MLRFALELYNRWKQRKIIYSGGPIIDIFATREEEDDSDECEVGHKRSEGA